MFGLVHRSLHWGFVIRGYQIVDGFIHDVTLSLKVDESPKKSPLDEDGISD